MKVALINTSDSKGGAARATSRLHMGLRNVGVDSQLIVHSKSLEIDNAISPYSTFGRMRVSGFTHLNHVLPKPWVHPGSTYTVPLFASSLSPILAACSADIIHLHWVGSMCSIESLNSVRQPMVWTLHDMWPFTGGCHYDDGCGQFKDRCGKCPKLTSDREYDLSRWVWARKNKHWNAVPLTIVSPSNWLADSAKRSSLFKNKTITVIPNGVDTTIYKPIEKRSARRILGLPETGRFILFGAMNSTSDFRKGFHLLLPALRALADADLSMNTELLVFGGTIADNAIDCGFPVRSLGFFQDDVSLALLYSAADVFVAPSLQENLANTVMEAMACGTPCVAFRVGGMPDMIDHMGTGYLCEPHSVEDLTYGIRWVLEGEERMHHLSGCSRDRAASKFNLESISLQYKSVYNALLNGDIEQSK